MKSIYYQGLCADNGWVGDRCDVPECTAYALGCRAGRCIAPNVCNCTGTGFNGSDCSIRTNSCFHRSYLSATCENTCLNGAKCTGPNTCDCTGTGYTGADCSTPMCNNPIGCGPGVCVAPEQCVCSKGWSGQYCTVRTSHQLIITNVLQQFVILRVKIMDCVMDRTHVTVNIRILLVPFVKLLCVLLSARMEEFVSLRINATALEPLAGLAISVNWEYVIRRAKMEEFVSHLINAIVLEQDTQDLYVRCKSISAAKVPKCVTI